MPPIAIDGRAAPDDFSDELCIALQLYVCNCHHLYAIIFLK